MRALFHMRPAAGAEPHTSLMCGLAPTSGASIAGERPRGNAERFLRAARDSLTAYQVDSCATVYKLHQQNDVNGLKHDDK